MLSSSLWCTFICKSVEHWLVETEDDPVTRSRIEKLMKIHEPFELLSSDGAVQKIVNKPLE